MFRLCRLLLVGLMLGLPLAGCGGASQKEVALPTVYVPPTLSVMLPSPLPSATFTPTATITPLPSRTPFPPTWTPAPTRTQPPQQPTLERQLRPTNTPFEIPTFDPSLPHPAAVSDQYVAPADSGAAPLVSSGVGGAVRVTDATFDSEVLNSPIPVVVEFWATWCGPCLEMAPIIEVVAAEYSGRVKVAKLDTDANPTMTSAYGIEGIPTFHIFSNGAVIETRVGAMSADELRAWIDESVR